MGLAVRVVAAPVGLAGAAGLVAEATLEVEARAEAGKLRNT